MKSSKYFLLLIILVFFVSCKQREVDADFGIDFLFKESQPPNDREVNHLPNKFIGNYINPDSTYLIIEDKIVYYKWKTKFYMSFSKFDSIRDSVKIIENRMYLFNKKNFYEFRKLKDSIELSYADYDTIFSISDSNKAKRIKGSIILNTKDSIYWKIKVLSLNKKSLSIISLASDADLARLDSFSKIKVQKIDSTKNLIELSKTEFKKMLTLKKLGSIQEYKKLE